MIAASQSFIIPSTGACGLGNPLGLDIPGSRPVQCVELPYGKDKIRALEMFLFQYYYKTITATGHKVKITLWQGQDHSIGNVPPTVQLQNYHNNWS